MNSVVLEGNKVLRQNSAPIPAEEIKSARIARTVSKMKEALSREPNGVAIAAPQIGETVRIFVVSGEVVSRRDKEGKILKREPDLVFINPRIVKTSKETELLEEGCLSVPGVQGDVPRYKEVSLSAYDGEGKKFTMKASAFMAQIFQHEIDHLNGILFTDKAINIRNIDSEKAE